MRCGQKWLCWGLCVGYAQTFLRAPLSGRRQVLIGAQHFLLIHISPLQLYLIAHAQSAAKPPPQDHPKTPSAHLAPTFSENPRTKIKFPRGLNRDRPADFGPGPPPGGLPDPPQAPVRALKNIKTL